MPYSPPGAQGSVRDQIRIMTHGEGVLTWDAEGREYLDGTSALEALILGHGDEEVVEAIAEQARTMSFVDVFRFVTPPQVELAAELVAASPGMAMAHFTPGGAEADEVAIKMARQYHALRGEPYRMKVITRQGAFHGVTARRHGPRRAVLRIAQRGLRRWQLVGSHRACRRLRAL